MTIEEARYWLATTARQLDFCAQSGRSPLEMAGRPMTADEISAWAAATAQAIRVIVQSASLPDTWRLIPDADEVTSGCGALPQGRIQ